MLNNYLNYEKLIINASTDGKTTKGYVNDFIHWFPKLENFSPEYAIFYIGINDSNFNQDSKFDIPWREDYLSRTKDYIKNNSKLVELIKKIQFKYFNDGIRKEYGVTRIANDLYKNYKYVNYQNAVKLYGNYKNYAHDGFLVLKGGEFSIPFLILLSTVSGGLLSFGLLLGLKFFLISASIFANFFAGHVD